MACLDVEDYGNDNLIHDISKVVIIKMENKEIEELKQIMYGKIDWIEVFKDAYEGRKTSWVELGHIQEWRNATDEVLFAVWKQLEKYLKPSDKEVPNPVHNGVCGETCEECKSKNRHSKGAVKPKGCGKEFTYDKDGDEYICGEEFEYDSGEESDSGCGYLLCPACSKENNLKVASLCENCGRTEAQHPIHPLSLTFARCQEFKPKKEE